MRILQEKLLGSCHPHSQMTASMSIIMTIQIASGIDQKHGIDVLRLVLNIVMDGMMQ